MSRNFAVLSKSDRVAAGLSPDVSPSVSPGGSRGVPTAGETAAPSPPGYVELIRRLFHHCSAVAVVGTGIDDTDGVCDGIAAELAASGKRVVVVSAAGLLSLGGDSLPDTNPATAETAFVPGAVPNVWHWPAPPAQQLRFFRAPAPVRQSRPDPDKWLDLLRHNFDSVLFSCQALEREKPESDAGVIDVVAVADSAVLVVEAGRTTRQRILLDQHALQSRGVRLAGCVLVRRR